MKEAYENFQCNNSLNNSRNNSSNNSSNNSFNSVYFCTENRNENTLLAFISNATFQCFHLRLQLPVLSLIFGAHQTEDEDEDDDDDDKYTPDDPNDDGPKYRTWLDMVIKFTNVEAQVLTNHNLCDFSVTRNQLI